MTIQTIFINSATGEGVSVRRDLTALTRAMDDLSMHCVELRVEMLGNFHEWSVVPEEVESNPVAKVDEATRSGAGRLVVFIASLTALATRTDGAVRDDLLELVKLCESHRGTYDRVVFGTNLLAHERNVAEDLTLGITRATEQLATVPQAKRHAAHGEWRVLMDRFAAERLGAKAGTIRERQQALGFVVQHLQKALGAVRGTPALAAAIGAELSQRKQEFEESHLGQRMMPAKRLASIEATISKWDRAVVEGRLADAEKLIPVGDEAHLDPYHGALETVIAAYCRRGKLKAITAHPGLAGGTGLELSDECRHGQEGLISYHLHLDGKVSDLVVEIRYEKTRSSYRLVFDNLGQL